MDLPLIGAHCALSTCHELDLLPIRCYCDNLFCRQHFRPEAHDCPAKQTKENPVSLVKLQRCAFESCDKPSLESLVADSLDDRCRTPATCPVCSFSFCALHRHASSHSCSLLVPAPVVKNEAARALLAKNFAAHISNKVSSNTPSYISRARIQTTLLDPAKLAQRKKIENMRMRQKAIPGDPKTNPASVGISERLHIKLWNEQPGIESFFWFRKMISTGRALDHLATHAGLTVTDERPLQLMKMSATNSEERALLLNHKPLSEEVEEGDTLLVIEGI